MTSRPKTTPATRTHSTHPNNSRRHPLPSLDDYVFTERLGSGTYATVYKAFKKRGDRETVAIKCVLKKSLNRLSTENLLTEIELLKLLKHDHIVQLKDFEWDENYIYLIMEYCAGGDLMSFLRQKRAIQEELVRKFLQQIALALKYMHEKNVTHLDLKPQNILLTSYRSPKLKIADFGFAHYLIGDIDTPYIKGSPLYMAPEIVCSKHYDAKADLWSVGVILYECLFGQAPWASSTLSELAEKIKENKPIEIPSGFEVSAECRDLVLKLLTQDPSDRISFDDFFSHPFLQLDKAPSQQSLPTAIEVVKQAIEEDQKGHMVKAIDLYIKALDHFIAALQYETNGSKKAKMREKITEYMERTEHLKQCLKTSIDSNPQPSYEYNELRRLASDHAQLPSILDMQEKALELEKEEKYDQSLERHQKCIKSLLSIASKLSEGRLKELLHQHIQHSLTRAEGVNDYINAVKSTKKKPKSGSSVSQSVKETCHMQ